MILLSTQSVLAAAPATQDQVVLDVDSIPVAQAMGGQAQMDAAFDMLPVENCFERYSSLLFKPALTKCLATITIATQFPQTNTNP